ncbi:hypothetical protein HDU93_009087 [Gonapodya sp. JEL0774]|nr:hypothetical protein HDU93_009087 [Gonapodya sp. JEL0774]
MATEPAPAPQTDLVMVSRDSPTSERPDQEIKHYRPISPLPTPPASPQISQVTPIPPMVAFLRAEADSADKASMRRIDSGVSVEADKAAKVAADARSESESSTLTSGKSLEEFNWTVATAQGYRLMPSTSIFASSPYYAKALHEHFEDFHWPNLSKPIHTPVPGSDAALAQQAAGTESQAKTTRSASPRIDGSGVLSNLVGLLRNGKSKVSNSASGRPSTPPIAPTTATTAPALETSSRISTDSDADTTSVSSSSPAITSSNRTNSHTSVHPFTGLPYTVFVLADGHGGHGAAATLVPRMKDEISRLVESRVWDFSAQADSGDLSTASCGRSAFRRLVEEIFERLDDEYCAGKVAEFTAYKAALAAHQLATQQVRETPYTSRAQTARAGAANQRDLPVAPKKPADDGCTMVVNVISDGWLVNANLGDSRTVLARRRYRVSTPASDVPAFSVCFASVDHSPTHPPSVHHVVENGGIFISENGTPRRFTPPPLVSSDTRKPSAAHRERYSVLAGSRVYRTLNDEMREGGVSNLKTLNLLGSLGDVGFKVGGRGKVIRSRPDVSFAPLRAGLKNDEPEKVEQEPQHSGSEDEEEEQEELPPVRVFEEVEPEGTGPIVDEYMYISCTDGVWDHLRCQSSDEAQCDGVVALAGSRIGAMISSSASEERDEMSEMEQVAMMLADRDRTRELYVPGVPRVDDVTVVLAIGRFVQ